MPLDTYVRHEGQAFIGVQPAWGVYKAPVAVEAFRYTKISIQEVPERESRTDQVGTRSRGESVEGRTTATFSIEGFVMGSTVAAVPMDIGELYKAIFGIETIGANVTYSLERDLETVFKGLTISHFGQHFMQSAKNCVVKEISLNVSGGDRATFSISGEATTVITTGSSTVAVIQSAGANIVQVAAGHGRMYRKDGVIKINGVGGHIVLSVAGDIITIVGTVTAAQVLGQLVVPDEPTGITAGSPISKIRGSFSHGGTTYKILSGSVKISDPLKVRNDEFGQAEASGFDAAAPREVSFQVSMRLLKGNFPLYGMAVDNIQAALILVIGNIAGSRVTINMPAVEITPSSIESPDEDPAVFEIAGFALPTVNENEITITSD